MNVNVASISKPHVSTSNFCTYFHHIFAQDNVFKPIKATSQSTQQLFFRHFPLRGFNGWKCSFIILPQPQGIIPFSKWLITMVIVSPKSPRWGCGTPSRWPKFIAYKLGWILTTETGPGMIPQVGPRARKPLPLQILQVRTKKLELLASVERI